VQLPAGSHCPSYYAAVSEPPYSPIFHSRKEALNAAKRDAKLTHNAQPFKIVPVPMTRPSGRLILDKQGKPIYTREYFYLREDKTVIVIQDHSAGHRFSGTDEGYVGAHFNIRPEADTRHGHVPGTRDHYNYLLQVH
jgi:hypothetical protein